MDFHNTPVRIPEAIGPRDGLRRIMKAGISNEINETKLICPTLRYIPIPNSSIPMGMMENQSCLCSAVVGEEGRGRM
jgi:hypothetical protein